MTRASVTRKGAAIAVGLLALTLVACWGEVVKVAEEAALTVTEDSRLTAGVGVAGAIKTESVLDRGVANGELEAAVTKLEPITAPDAGGSIAVATTKESMVLALVREETGELFSEAICQGMLEITLWHDPSATADSAHWARFLVAYVEKRAQELLLPTAHDIVVNRATALTAALRLGSVNVGRAIPYAKACLAGILTVTKQTPQPTRTTVAIGDSCLIGRWILRNKSITATVGSVPTPMFGGGGAVLTIDADGTALIDYGPSKPFVGTANGQTVAIESRGTAISRIHGNPPHQWVETIQSQAITTQWFINGQWQQPTVAPVGPSTTYSCTTTTLTQGDSAGSDSYSRS